MTVPLAMRLFGRRALLFLGKTALLGVPVLALRAAISFAVSAAVHIVVHIFRPVLLEQLISGLSEANRFILGKSIRNEQIV